ncbi:MYND-type zinc finger-containing chromatin reader Zmynd8 [Calliphora vicina]|uniref:MYND-type zinc finger-containing chromatin reader Zmynd8 n=1 Tax=Calliphora vicina TaxID=7373 RepID=UPI00325B3E63
MENNDRTADESLDSVPQPTYEALESVSTDLNECVDKQKDDDDDDDMEKESKEDAQFDSDHDMEKLSKEVPSSSSSSSTSQNHHNDSNMLESPDESKHIEDEDFSLEYEEEEDMCEEFSLGEPQSYVQYINADNKNNDPLIVQGNDGMIKKIKISNTSKVLLNNKTESKTKKSLSSSQPRSNTPMSREYLALQRSVNESKILTEFVTEVANEKPRKVRAKEATNSLTTSIADHSYSANLRKSTQLTPEKVNPDDSYHSNSPSQGKRQHSKRFVALKESDSDVDASSNLRPRSRSKSMHNSELNQTGSHKKLKKWPSEERIHKRTNMRSENSEFAQKQMEFLQRVIHACENPPSRSRSRSRSDGRSMSCGRKTPNSINEPSFAGVTTGAAVVVQPPKSHKSRSKDRNSKRSKYEMSSENDEQQQLPQHLGDNANEQADDESVNESQASLMGISSLGDTMLADNDTEEAHSKTVWQPAPKPGYDSFCWKCHENKVNLCCCRCIRSFHAACVKINKFDNIWLCPECTTVENLLNNPKRSRRNELSLDLLSQLLSFALKRMRYTKGHYNFVMPYEESTIYKKYIVNPVTLTELQTKIETKEFRCAEEFVNETKWMLHNAYILSHRNNTKIVLAAKSIFKIGRQEANEIETCAECYLNANTRTDWFVDVCSQPHLLLWAKLKGFPYWPAKAMGLGQNSLINVRFFGEHDRAFVPLKDCYLYSEQDPNTATGKRAARELADCIKEVEEHVAKIRVKVGGFKYAPFKTPYDPADEFKQLSEMMPGVEDFIRKQQGMIIKPPLQFKIYKTADNNLSIVQKASPTPELTTLSTHDSEEKEKDIKEKKKKSTSESNDSKKLEDLTTLPPKYEVVSKVNSDDSNSSKLSTVILKRKSINGDCKETNEDETVELPLPKMTKLEDHVLEEDINKSIAKRKADAQCMEKPKAKHAKLEPKIPIMTIKTSVVKDPSSVNTNKTNTKSVAEVKANDAENSKQLTVLQETETTSATQKVMESLVKHKQGVTIKKISKDLQNSTSPDQSSLNNSKESEKESPNDKTVDKQKTEEEKARENQKVNNILKGLVPFVEVKKEVLSDNEEETEKQQLEKPVGKETQTENTITTNKDNLQKSQESKENNTHEQINSNKTEGKPAEKPIEKEGSNAPITQVKEEVLSDNEEANLNSNPNTNQTTLVTKINLSGGSSNLEKQTATASTSEIRVVGDTTIQKLSKNQYYAYSTNSGAANNSGSISTNNNTKRSTLKGVPYGPLPASAFPKSLISKPFIQSDISLQPRAKKSFAQHSPPIEKLRPSTIQNAAPQMPTQSLAQHLDQKRTMSKNTMVTIPVDVATNRASTSAGTIIIGSIPVPPLTAVSKTVQSAVAQTSTARSSPATITVSGTSGSLTTPSIMAQAKTSITTVSTTSSTTIRNSPITVTSASLLAPLTSIASLSSTPVSSTQNPLTMTTPPPLAGLSNSSLNATPQTNGVNDANNTATISTSPATQQPSADTHLLGGLVTPTLASAITDVICRGPPKLAARPTGPFQSEGYPMFPSQAGPVCKRLVENVHKLTDFFISVVEDTMGEMAQGEEPGLQAKITLLTMELERSKQAYEQEIAELKRTSDLMLCEMRKSMENEKTRLAIEIRKQCEMERLRSVEETKRKQWCANCFREANFYCCWNTSYCDYPCQQLHWSRHSNTCAQTRVGLNESTGAPTTNTSTERHHNTKSNSTITLSSSANFNKSSPVSQKKEKGAAKNSSNHMMSSTISTVTPASASRTNTEVLKLPTNTYLRPVTSNLNNQTLRCNTTYSIPVQRFNAPTTNSPQTYTIVQQGNNSWVMSSTHNSNNNSGSSSGNSSATNSSTIAAPIASVPQVPGQARSTGTSMGSILTNKSQKPQIRYH